MDADLNRLLYSVAIASLLLQTGFVLMLIEIEQQRDRINIGKIFKDLKLKS